MYKEIGKEMPKYRSHKELWALKIKNIILDSDLAKEEDRDTTGGAIIIPEEEGYASFTVNFEYMKKHKPQIGGYYVVYEDDYESFSPSEAFEKGNIKIGFHNARRIEILRIDNNKNQFYANIIGDNGEDLFSNSEQGHENKQDLIDVCEKYFSAFPIIDKTIEEDLFTGSNSED
jgi:hypothetical protein